jgi:predicted DNA-binding transcriptional regulator YafY
MLETSARLLRLLSLLQAQRDWTGPELAARLGVSSRTVRTDVERLRELGYPVHATPGARGGYRLAAGHSLPPLLLDDDEAVAVAVGLRTAAGGAVAGIEETSVRALVKLLQVLPHRLRRRLDTLSAGTMHVPGAGADADVLTALATAIHATEQLRFDYQSHAGAPSRRVTEPHRLVHRRGHWYLVAWDVGRADWRTFRVDRITPRAPTGPRFAPRAVPEDDVTAYLHHGAGAAGRRYHALVRVHAPPDEVRARLPLAIAVTPAGPDCCVAEVGSDTLHLLTLYLGLLDVDFDVLDAPELARHLVHTADRFRRAAGLPDSGPDRPIANS